MRIHHINCGTMCPVSARLVNGQGGLFDPARMICHCLLLEIGEGLVLVDSGLGLQDVESPERLGPLRPILRAKLDPAETALRQVKALGFAAEDVRHVVLTHLDLDHAGGIADFPHARVHVMRRERDAALAPRPSERIRYRPPHWAHAPDWAVYDAGGEPWLGFEAVRQLDGLPPEILLVPLHGHTRGHAGVAIDTSAGWLLHCGDAYFHHLEMDPESPRCPPGLVAFQAAAEVHRAQRLWNQRRLRALVREHSDHVRLVNAHDPHYLGGTDLRS